MSQNIFNQIQAYDYLTAREIAQAVRCKYQMSEQDFTLLAGALCRVFDLTEHGELTKAVSHMNEFKEIH